MARIGETSAVKARFSSRWAPSASFASCAASSAARSTISACASARSFDRRLHEALDRVGDVVRLVDHIGGANPSALRRSASISSLKTRKSRNGATEPASRSSSPYLKSLKWKPASFPETHQPGDDLLDVDVGRVVAEIDQAERLGPEFLRRGEARAPVGNHRRIERRLVELVLDEHLPVGGQRGVDFAHRVDIAVERLGEVRLAGEIRAVGDPHRQRLRAEPLADLDTFEIVVDRGAAHRRVGVAQRAELVRKRLAGLVLEGVGIDRVEGEAARFRRLAQRGEVARSCPREYAARWSASPARGDGSSRNRRSCRKCRAARRGRENARSACRPCRRPRSGWRPRTPSLLG